MRGRSTGSTAAAKSPEISAKVQNRIFHPLIEGFSAWRDASLTPLKHGHFRTLWLAAMASNFGAVMQTVGASWLMTTLDPSPNKVALVQTAAMLPIVLIALPAGALADTADRRTLMLLSQFIGLFGAVALAFLAINNAITPVTLLAFTAVIGAATALHQPSWQASFADLIPKKDLTAAIGMNSLAFNVARSLGPALGGAMLAAAGAAAVFIINALSFLGLIAALAWKKISNPAPTLPPEAMGEAIRTGLRYVAMSPTLPPIYLRSAMFAFGGSIVPALAPLVAHDFLSSGPIEYGLLLAGFGAGSLFGALMLAYFRVRYGVERLVTVANVAYTVSVVVLGLSRFLPLSTCMMAIAGACWILVLASISTSVQLCSPRWVVGRAIAFSQIASVGGIAIGAFVWGAVAKAIGLQDAFLAAAAYLAAASFIGRIAPLPLREFNLSPNDDLTIPPPHLHIDNQTGPLIVTIEYEVPQKDAASFLTIMHQLGRIRKRDGAQRWRIFQDIDRPEVWIEQIESATWLDHLRRASRSTVDDTEIRLKAEQYRTRETPAIKRMAQRPRGSEPLN